jgi:hypothetical protein
LLIGFGLLLFLGGCLFRGEFDWRGRLGMVVGGAAFALVVGPGVLGGQVAVDDRQFEVTSGFWLWPKTETIRFDDLREIRWLTRQDHRGRTSYQVQCVLKGGDTRTLPVNDAFEEAVPDVLGKALARGVPVTGLPNGRLPFQFGNIPGFESGVPAAPKRSRPGE